MKKYLSFFRIRFIAGLQYRAAAWAGIATQFAWGGMTILMFWAFYQSGETSYFAPNWQFDPERRLWNTEYSEYRCPDSPSEKPRFENNTDSFRQALSDIEKLAIQIRCEGFAHIFFFRHFPAEEYYQVTQPRYYIERTAKVPAVAKLLKPSYYSCRFLLGLLVPAPADPHHIFKLVFYLAVSALLKRVPVKYRKIEYNYYSSVVFGSFIGMNIPPSATATSPVFRVYLQLFMVIFVSPAMQRTISASLCQ